MSQQVAIELSTPRPTQPIDLLGSHILLLPTVTFPSGGPITLARLRLRHLAIFEIVPLVLVIVRATAVVEIANVGAVEDGLLKGLVDLVVHVAAPCRCCVPRADLRWEFVYYRSEMGGAFSAARLTWSVMHDGDWGRLHLDWCWEGGVAYHGYMRWKRCVQARRVAFWSSVGFSGKRANVVWNSFQAARPSSALVHPVSESCF